MNVYVESNFVLEQALEQEQCESCEELISIATAGSIHLVVPAFSLAEPHIALMRRGNERSRLTAELQKHVSELGRSKRYREASGNFNDLAANTDQECGTRASRVTARHRWDAQS